MKKHNDLAKATEDVLRFIDESSIDDIANCLGWNNNPINDIKEATEDVLRFIDESSVEDVAGCLDWNNESIDNINEATKDILRFIDEASVNDIAHSLGWDADLSRTVRGRLRENMAETLRTLKKNGLASTKISIFFQRGLRPNKLVSSTLFLICSVLILMIFFPRQDLGMLFPNYPELPEAYIPLQNMSSEDYQNHNPRIQLLKYIEVNPNKALLHIVSNSFNEATPSASPLDFGEDIIIGTDSDGNDLSLGDLEGESFYMVYQEKGSEVWFYGRLSEQGKWDGYCILNQYKNDELFALFESQYDNGVCLGTYKQWQKENDRYRLQKRTWCEGFTDGETFVYKGLSIPEEKIKSDTPIKFDDCQPYTLFQYYKGRISNNKYNDRTGNAILINYTEDEENVVRTFYHGNISNGNFNDDRPFNDENPENCAFRISLVKQSYYSYYRGPFSGNSSKGPEVPIGTDENPSDMLPVPNDYPELKWKQWAHSGN